MKNIEFEFTILNHTYLVKLASYMYQYLRGKNLLEDFNNYLKNK